MGKPFRRRNKLWFRYKDPETKKWTNKATGCAVGQEADAQRYIASFLQLLAEGKAPTGPITVAQFAKKWLAKRTNVSVADDRARITKHVLPHIGSMPMVHVRPRHIRDLIIHLKDEGKLAPSTVRGVSGLLHTMFDDAVIDEVIVSTPCVLKRGTLPKKMDKDPTWRAEAIFTREEAEQLISDPRILPDRRVLYALKFLAGGMRHGEAARLTWRQYDSRAEPLGRIALGHTKSGVPRAIPVHPTLAKILAQWKLSGWFETFGRQPTSEDYIVPTRNFSEENPRGTVRMPTESQQALVHDLKLLGLRVRAGQKRKRRGHDLRRTFVTIARADGALDGPLRWVTHGPSAGNMTELYSTFSWSMLCAEVAKVKVELREGQMIALSTDLVTASLRREESASRRWRNRTVSAQKMATPTGRKAIGTKGMVAMDFLALLAA